jgi:hypothetical protein
MMSGPHSSLKSGPHMSFTKVSPSLNDEWTPLVIIVFFMEPHAPDRQWPSCEVHDTQELSVDGALRMAMTVHRSRASTAHLTWLRRRIGARLRRQCRGLTKPVPTPPVEARLGGHARDGCWQPLPPQANRPPPPLSLFLSSSSAKRDISRSSCKICAPHPPPANSSHPRHQNLFISIQDQSLGAAELNLNGNRGSRGLHCCQSSKLRSLGRTGAAWRGGPPVEKVQCR